MRVTYLSASGELGGAERSLLDVLAIVRQAEPSWPLHLIAAASGPLTLAACALGVATTVLPFPEGLSRLGDAPGRANGGRSVLGLAPASVAALSYALLLRRAIATARPDVLHSNSLKMHLLAAWTSPRVRPLWHLHDYLGNRVRTARLMRWSARRSAG